MTQDTLLRLDPLPETLRPARQWVLGAIGLGILLIAMPAHANDSQGPWECSGYSGEAHTRCLASFVEAQREQIASLQGKVQAQQETVNQLKAQMDRQASANAAIQPQVVQPPTVVQTVPPLYGYPPVYAYGYPPFGVGLYIGRPWFYGPPYFYRPYFYGSRYFGYRHWGHR
jgi:uncharacterized coiled-coil protein SlyX